MFEVPYCTSEFLQFDLWNRLAHSLNYGAAHDKNHLFLLKRQEPALNQGFDLANLLTGLGFIFMFSYTIEGLNLNYSSISIIIVPDK